MTIWFENQRSPTFLILFLLQMSWSLERSNLILKTLDTQLSLEMLQKMSTDLIYVGYCSTLLIWEIRNLNRSQINKFSFTLSKKHYFQMVPLERYLPKLTILFRSKWRSGSVISVVILDNGYSRPGFNCIVDQSDDEDGKQVRVSKRHLQNSSVYVEKKICDKT